MALIYRSQVSTDNSTWISDSREGTYAETGFDWRRFLRWGYGPGTYYLRVSASLDNGTTWGDWSPSLGPITLLPKRVNRRMVYRQ